MQITSTRRVSPRRLALPLIGLAAVFAVAIAGQQAAADSDSTERPTSQNGKVQGSGTSGQDAAESDDATKSRETVRDDGDGATTEVQVNGETLTVPKNGSYQRTTDDGDSRTDVKVDNRNESYTSGDGSSNSSSSEVRIDVRSESHSSSGGG
jgi:hypothetical protein